MLIPVDIEAMRLKDTFLRRGDAANLLFDTGDVLILGVTGIDADSQELSWVLRA